MVNHLPSFKPMPSTFLQAEWRKLAMANYAVDPNVLQPYLPKGVELDFWNGTCYASLIGFMFLNTKLKGIKIPFHNNFEEVNLRFYVRRKVNGQWRRGTVFIAEFVPKPMITLVARSIYGEQYFTKKMNHTLELGNDALEATYRWKTRKWNSLSIRSENRLCDVEAGSETEFIMEHYWGYTQKGQDRTAEYGVEHPRWQVYPTQHFSADIDFADCYGADFSALNAINPSSGFLLEGSEILVREGRIINL